MAASTAPTSSTDGATKLPSSSSSDHISKGKKARRSSSQGGASTSSDLQGQETKKKTKGIFGKLTRSLRKKSKSSISSTSTSAPETSSENLSDVSTSRDKIPTISSAGMASPEVLQTMVQQVQTTRAVEIQLIKRLELSTTLDSLEAFDAAMEKYFLTKRDDLKLTPKDETVVTPRAFIKHVVLPFHEEAQQLSPLDAIQQSIQHAFDNDKNNLSYEAPEWMEPVLQHREMFETIGSCPSVNELSPAQIEFLQHIHAQLSAEDLDALKPISSPRPQESSST